MTSPQIRVLLADDHAVVREGYRSLLQGQADMCVVAEAKDGDGAYRLSRKFAPDVVVMDLSMQGGGGLEAMARIRQVSPTTGMLVFTMHLNASFAVQAFRAGASGYVTKSSPPQMLIQAVRDVCAGRPALSPDIAAELAYERAGSERSLLQQLSPREFEVLRLRMDLHSIDEISESLHISPKTVANLYYQLKAKLGAPSDIELVHMALRAGLVKPLAA
ncbi:MAG TPA: response regulator transcription factor [Burkholderiaceae bacterium]|nr:response regulator transcription factor [Burkholderiaceae bacterium]